MPQRNKPIEKKMISISGNCNAKQICKQLKCPLEPTSTFQCHRLPDSPISLPLLLLISRWEHIWNSLKWK